jgi:tRNA(Ile)-lysidine synthase
LHGLALEVGLELTVAHLDHGARGAAAQADAQFVADLAAQLGLPMVLGHWEPARTGGFEANARRARYAWLADVARQRNASVIATGHTHDDQAETILHRILRGTGMRGLAGIPVRRMLSDSVILARPFIDVTRLEIRDYLVALGQPFCHDATNADLSRTRTRIRHKLLPRLAEEYNPRVADALVRLGQLASGAERALEPLLGKLEQAVVVELQPNRVNLDRQAFAALSAHMRAALVRRVWNRLGWPEAKMAGRRWIRIARLARCTEGRVSVGHGVEVIISTNEFRLDRNGVRNDCRVVNGAVALPLPGSACWGTGRAWATMEATQPRDETIDLSQVAPPLCVRAPEPGDRFSPLGMAQGSMSLSAFLRNRHVPGPERSRVPLVCDQEGIVWVVGHRIAERVRLTEKTRETLGLRWDSEQFGEPGQEGTHTCGSG